MVMFGAIVPSSAECCLYVLPCTGFVIVAGRVAEFGTYVAVSLIS